MSEFRTFFGRIVPRTLWAPSSAYFAEPSTTKQNKQKHHQQRSFWNCFCFLFFYYKNSLHYSFSVMSFPITFLFPMFLPFSRNIYLPHIPKRIKWVQEEHLCSSSCTYLLPPPPPAYSSFIALKNPHVENSITTLFQLLETLALHPNN